MPKKYFGTNIGDPTYIIATDIYVYQFSEFSDAMVGTKTIDFGEKVEISTS